MKKFTKEEDDYIRQNYLLKPSYAIAKEIGRSKFGLYNRIKILGLVIPPELVQKFKDSSRFKKGNISHNKGLKREDFMSNESIQKMKDSEFKKGNIPHNHKPIGHERVDKDGYTFIKIKEPNVFELKNRVIWETANGVIPKDHLIIFKNKNKQDLRLENLELISIKENLARNSYHNYGKEIASLIQLRGALNRQINKRNK